MKIFTFGHDADATHKTLALANAMAAPAPAPHSKAAVVLKYAKPALAIGGASALAVAYSTRKKDPYRKPIALGGALSITAALLTHAVQKYS
jgi:hypothetical protein